jgi:hypothetical protein
MLSMSSGFHPTVVVITDFTPYPSPFAHGIRAEVAPAGEIPVVQNQASALKEAAF